MEGKVVEKYTKKLFGHSPVPNDEPLELTEVVEEPADDNYVLYGAERSDHGRPRARRRSLIDLSALEDVALTQAQEAVAKFLAAHGAEILAAQAKDTLAEVAREVAREVAPQVLREKAVEVLTGVAEQVAIVAAREVMQVLAAQVIERVAREVVPKVAEEIIVREIERVKTSVRAGL